MHICTTAPILFKQTMNQLTSSAANFKTAVNGVLSGTLNLKYNHANESLCNNGGKKKTLCRKCYYREWVVQKQSTTVAYYMKHNTV